jgi:gluconolactonase
MRLAVTLSLLLLSSGAVAKPLIPPGAKLEKVAGDLRFGEGPAWHPDGYLLFEDIPQDRIHKLDAKAKVSVFREPSGKSNGLAFDAQGRLIACEGGNRRVTRTEKDGRVVVLAERYNEKRLNSPNDLALDAQGRVYFTDPRYGDRAGMEQDKEAVYRIDPDGTTTRVTDEVARPNGILVSLDGKSLYVADNPGSKGRRLLLVFDLQPDGRATNRRVVFEHTDGRGIDGMALDGKGRIWATAGAKEKAGVHAFELNAERTEARIVHVLRTPEDPTNCAFGGKKRDWLYITTPASLFRIRTSVRGAPSPPGK